MAVCYNICPTYVNGIVEQIISLKRKHGIVEDDATPDKEREWYSWAIINDHIEYVVRDGELKGFIEWVRLPYIPANKWDIRIDHSIMDTACVLLAGNAIAEEPGILKIMMKRGLSKIKGWTYLVWHNKKKNTFKVFKNKEKQHE